jgi:uncharacterized protein
MTSNKHFLQLAGYALLAYLAVWALLCSPLYTRIILRPDRNQSKLYATDRILDAPRQEYFFDSHGSKLHGWLFQKPHSNSIAIVHHGNAGNILNRLFLAKALITAGTSVFLYDYRGYGKSTGTPSLAGILDDGLAAFDFVKDKFAYPVIINYGESIGSGVACNVNAHRKTDALILQSGITSLPNVAKDGVILLRLYPNFMWPQPQFDNYVSLSHSKTPLLLLHGERDRLVPAAQSQRLFDCASTTDKNFVKLPNCGHNDVGFYDADLFQNAITDFVHKSLKNDVMSPRPWPKHGNGTRFPVMPDYNQLGAQMRMIGFALLVIAAV